MIRILLLEDRKFYQESMQEACNMFSPNTIELVIFKPKNADASLDGIISDLREFISSKEFDIVFVDLKLWGQFTGLHAIKLLKEFSWYSKAVPVAFSGIYTSNQHLQDAGAKYYNEEKPALMDGKEARKYFLNPAIQELGKLRGV